MSEALMVENPITREWDKDSGIFFVDGGDSVAYAFRLLSETLRGKIESEEIQLEFGEDFYLWNDLQFYQTDFGSRMIGQYKVNVVHFKQLLDLLKTLDDSIKLEMSLAISEKIIENSKDYDPWFNEKLLSHIQRFCEAIIKNKFNSYDRECAVIKWI